MQIIDADTHIDETEATWEYLRDFEQEFKPITAASCARGSFKKPGALLADRRPPPDEICPRRQ